MLRLGLLHVQLASAIDSFCAQSVDRTVVACPVPFRVRLATRIGGRAFRAAQNNGRGAARRPGT